MDRVFTHGFTQAGTSDLARLCTSGCEDVTSILSPPAIQLGTLCTEKLSGMENIESCIQLGVMLERVDPAITRGCGASGRSGVLL